MKIESIAGDANTDLARDEKKETEQKEAAEHSDKKNKDGMFSDSYYERTGWNLNNLAASEGSVLKYLQVRGPRIPYSIYVHTFQLDCNTIDRKGRYCSIVLYCMILIYILNTLKSYFQMLTIPIYQTHGINT